MTHDTQADYTTAMRTALQILKHHLITEPPVVPSNIIQHYGLGLSYIDFEDQYKGVAGFLDVHDGVIFVNKQDTPAEQMFTIAHEFGHWLLHRNLVNFQRDEFPVFMRNMRLEEETDYVEQEANCFAENLLTPNRLLNNYKNKLTTSELAGLFMVSENFIRYRLNK